MITLITGIPGSGKTSFCVGQLMETTGRPIYVDGVPDLKLPHEPCPPIDEWTHDQPDPSSASGYKTSFTFPPNSIIVIDEAQRVYRPRAVGSKVPPYVAAFETHRHEGLDFWLITQNPTLIDSNVRKLVGRHIHLRPTWAGRYLHEWNECADVESTTARSIAATRKYTLPKKAFDQYRSAVLHTKNKARIPFVVWVFAAAVLSCVGLAWHLYGRFNEINTPKTAESQQAPGAASVSPSGAPVPLTPAQYVAEYRPRIPGLLHTAPAYDTVTQVMEAPIIAGCVQGTKTPCKCYDQRGNTYRTTPEICRQYLDGGIYFAFRPSDQAPQVRANAAQSSADESKPLPNG